MSVITRDLPFCHWCITDCRTGVAIDAGYFSLGDAVDEAMRVLAAMPQYRNFRDERPVMSVDPWFQTQADEFCFWAEFWAKSDVP